MVSFNCDDPPLVKASKWELLYWRSLIWGNPPLVGLNNYPMSSSLNQLGSSKDSCALLAHFKPSYTPLVEEGRSHTQEEWVGHPLEDSSIFLRDIPNISVTTNIHMSYRLIRCVINVIICVRDPHWWIWKRFHECNSFIFGFISPLFPWIHFKFSKCGRDLKSLR